MRALKTAAGMAVRRSRLLFRAYQAYSFHRLRPRLEERARAGDLKLHLGCGPHLLPGWVNIDLALTRDILAAELPGGLRRFQDDSTRLIYASHVLEHIEYPIQAREFARECHRILAPGGIARIVVPDIELIIGAYARGDDEFFAIQAGMHPAWCTTKLEHLMYAVQQDGRHKYGFDFDTASKLLLEAGFNKVVRSDFGASESHELRVDYRESRDNHGNDLSLYVEAVK